MKKDQQVLHFLETHGWLLNDPRFPAEAKRQLRLHSPSLARAQQEGAAANLALASRRRSRRLAAVSGGDARERHLPHLRRRLPRGARVRAASRGCGRTPRTASTSVCSRWGRPPGASSGTAPPRPSRRKPRIGTSSRRAGTGARGPASPGARAPSPRISSANCGTRPDSRVPRTSGHGRCPGVTWLGRKSDRLRPLDEAAAYARCHGERDESVRIVKLPPRRVRSPAVDDG